MLLSFFSYYICHIRHCQLLSLVSWYRLNKAPCVSTATAVPLQQRAVSSGSEAPSVGLPCLLLHLVQTLYQDSHSDSLRIKQELQKSSQDFTTVPSFRQILISHFTHNANPRPEFPWVGRGQNKNNH